MIFVYLFTLALIAHVMLTLCSSYNQQLGFVCMLICIVAIDAILYAKFGDDIMKLIAHSVLIILIIFAYVLVMVIRF
jgi:hypothetical protein